MNKRSPKHSIYYNNISNSPIGSIWIAASDIGLLSIEFDLPKREFIKNLQNNWGRGLAKPPKPKRSRKILKPYIDKIKGYLDSTYTDLDLTVDLTEQTPFQRNVLQTTMGIQFGQIITYADLAKRIDQPTASRAVGQALRRNPIPIVIPCHRVLHSDGTLGGYGGVLGSERKIALLKLEGSILA